MSRRNRDVTPFSLFAFQDIITAVTGIIVLVTLLLALDLFTRKPNTPDLDTHALAEQARRAIAAAQAEQVELEAQRAQDQTVVLATARLSPSEVERRRYDLTQESAQLRRELSELDAQVARAAAARDKLEAERYERRDDAEQLAALRAQLAALEAKLAELEQSERMIYNLPPDAEKQAWLVEVGEEEVQVARAGIDEPPQTYSARETVLSDSPLTEWIRTRQPAREYFVLLVRPQGVRVFDDLREHLRREGFEYGFDLIGRDVTVFDPEHGAAAP